MHLDLLQLLVEQHVVTSVPTTLAAVAAVQVAELAHEAVYAVVPAAVVATN